MPRVAALYRYPVKGFTPEACETLTVLDGRIAGDRVLGIRSADTAQRPMRPGVRKRRWWP